MTSDPNPYDATEAARVAVHGTDAETVALNDWVCANPEAAGSLFEQLSHHRDPDVRDWVAFQVGRSGYTGAVQILTRLAADPSPEVQEVAIGELIELDHEAAVRSVRPQLQRQLTEAPEAAARIVALWRLARLDDRDSIELIRRAAQTEQVPATDAEFAERVLGGQGDLVLDVLHQHDPVRALPAIRAARAMRSDAAIAALAACADANPDAGVRRACQRVLDEIGGG